MQPIDTVREVINVPAANNSFEAMATSAFPANIASVGR